MPLTAKGSEILANLEKEYGEKHGKEVLYAGKNSGRFTGIDSVKLAAFADAAEDLKSRMDSYCARGDDHRVIGGVKLPKPEPRS